MDRFAAMKIFARVAELQSFTQAAESLDLPKATVSTSVQQLEALVGTKLLHRTTRRVQLTAEGTSFYERCQDLLADLEETESMFRSDSAQLRGKVRVDMTVVMARELVIPRLPAFLEAHPGIEIELSSTDRHVDLIREGIDCVARVGRGLEAGLMAREIGEMETVNCASPAYIAKFGLPRQLEDLRRHRLIYYVQHLGSRPEGFEYFDGEKYREFKMGGVITVNNIIAYQAACLAGLGIIQCPRVGVRGPLARGELVEVLPEIVAEPMLLKLVYPQRRMLAKRVRVFMDWIEPILKAYLTV